MTLTRFFVIGEEYIVADYGDKIFIYLGTDTNGKYVFFSSGSENLKIELTKDELEKISLPSTYSEK